MILSVLLMLAVGPAPAAHARVSDDEGPALCADGTLKASVARCKGHEPARGTSAFRAACRRNVQAYVTDEAMKLSGRRDASTVLAYSPSLEACRADPTARAVLEVFEAAFTAAALSDP